jgi:hypothetical protein
MSDRASHLSSGPVAVQSPAERRVASWAGWLMAATFVTSIPALLLYHDVLNDTDFILGAGNKTRVEIGALLEVLQAVAQIGVAVVMFPILRRKHERIALGYVASRTVESTMVVIGAMALLSVLTLREDLAASIGANQETLGITGRTLVEIHDRTFLMGPGFCVGVNGLLLGYAMYSTGLMPSRLAIFGIIGGPLLFASSIAVLFGAYDQTDGGAGILAVPEIIFEASFAIYLIVKGFRASPVLTGPPVAAAAG